MKNSDTLLDTVKNIDTNIDILETENKELKGQIDELANSARSAEGMLDDSQITRNQVFYGNIILFLILAGGGYIYYKKKIAGATK